MQENVMVVDGDSGEIISYKSHLNPDWKTVVDDTDSDLDCTVLRAEAVVIIGQMGWTILGEEKEENISCLYIRTDPEYVGHPNPWAESK